MKTSSILATMAVFLLNGHQAHAAPSTSPESQEEEIHIAERVLADNDFVPGQCGVHIVQEVETQYLVSLQAILKDGAKKEMDNIQIRGPRAFDGVRMEGQLPEPFEVRPGLEPEDPIAFRYGDQTWKSTDDRCSVGGYDGNAILDLFGKNRERQMDCGFECKKV